jgi:chemotaxis signal transduction protein
MIAEEPVSHEDAMTSDAEWCYLVSLGGNLFAVPDNAQTVLLPYISSVPTITPLPKGLVPAHVLGLINVAQRGELLIDLPRLLGLRNGPAGPTIAESRRVLLIGEATPPEIGEYRIAFAVDYGYELFQAGQATPTKNHPLGSFVTAIVETPHGEAVRLDMEEVCNAVLRDMGAERLWNEPALAHEEDEV